MKLRFVRAPVGITSLLPVNSWLPLVGYCLLLGCSAPKPLVQQKTNNPETNQVLIIPPLLNRETTPHNRAQAMERPWDTRATMINSPFAEYDEALIDSLRSHWYAMLQTNLSYDLQGEVVVKFKLPPEGTISDVTILRSTVNATVTSICENAVLASAPFQPWSGRRGSKPFDDYVHRSNRLRQKLDASQFLSAQKARNPCLLPDEHP